MSFERACFISYRGYNENAPDHRKNKKLIEEFHMELSNEIRISLDPIGISFFGLSLV